MRLAKRLLTCVMGWMIQVFWNMMQSLFKHIFFLLPTNATMTHPIKEQKSGTMTNNHSSNLNGGNIYDLWVIQCHSSKACGSRCNHTWQRYGKCTIRDKHRNYEQSGIRKKWTTRNAKTPNQTIVTPTYIKLAQPKT